MSHLHALIGVDHYLFNTWLSFNRWRWHKQAFPSRVGAFFSFSAEEHFGPCRTTMYTCVHGQLFVLHCTTNWRQPGLSRGSVDFF